MEKVSHVAGMSMGCSLEALRMDEDGSSDGVTSFAISQTFLEEILGKITVVIDGGAQAESEISRHLIYFLVKHTYAISVLKQSFIT